MAHIRDIWIHSNNLKNKSITAHVLFRPIGEAQVEFKVPDDFYDCILKMAQNAADLQEQQMRAQILADNQPKQNTGE